MFRLFGFLIGSAASVVAILLVTGMPKFHLEDPVIDQQRFDEAVEKLLARKQDAEPAVSSNAIEVEPQAIEAVMPDDEQEPLPPSVATAGSQAITEVNARPASATEALSQSAADIGFSEAGFAAPALTEMQWYSFWNPFRSEIAANGFVSRLEKVTGLDYRIVKIKTGVYEVAFAYDDDTERRTKLTQISAATGLDLPDS